MYKSDSILAHMRTAVAKLPQRGQATLPGHLIFIPVFRIFNRLAKASGFCLYFYTKRLYNHIVMPDLITIATCSYCLVAMILGNGEGISPLFKQRRFPPSRE